MFEPGKIYWLVLMTSSTYFFLTPTEHADTYFPAAYTSAVSNKFTPLSYAMVISCSAIFGK